MITEDTVKTGIEELRRQATMLIDTADDIGNPGLVCGSVQAVLVNRLITTLRFRVAVALSSVGDDDRG